MKGGLEGRLRLAGTLIAIGLLVEAITLIDIHPLAFLTFMFVGGGFLLAGIVIFLLAIVRAAPAQNEGSS